MHASRRICAALSFAAIACCAGAAAAQDVTLRLHQFLPAQATVPTRILQPWIEAIEAESGGRIKIRKFDAMSLGGTPPELLDQARDGVVDIAMAIVGYTPNRFPRSEVFELPFIMKGAEATSRAYWDLVESDLQDGEFRDVQVLAAWVHGAGSIHSRRAVRTLEDMDGLKLRAPTRVSYFLLEALGATPVGIPLPATAEALSKGVIDGTVISWEVVPSLRLQELVGYHTEFGGEQGLYTTDIVLVMNRARYRELPDDLRAIIDAHSGAELSAMAGRTMESFDETGREAARAAGNEIIVIEGEEEARWRAAAGPVYDKWYAEMEAKGIDGPALVERVRALIDQHTR